MNTIKNFDKLYELKSKDKSYFAVRIFAQIEYAFELARLENKNFEIIEKVIDEVYDYYIVNGAITKEVSLKAENDLKPFSARAKKDTVLCVAHGHIDMNWMWGYDETVSVTLATFRTMLALMKEYKDFTYSQSQASCYEIVEKFDKPMLEEIKERIKEGRWEVSASTWVEPDKNMTGSESLCRHYVYTKQYLSKLLNIDAESLNVDFEPDTFGHNGSIPEIMNKGGVKYYYHCRGNLKPALYRWYAENEKSSVIVFREPKWYNWSINYDDFKYVAEFCSQNKISKILKVYGTGDHGGGATRCDLDKLIDMNSWSVMPNFKFSSYKEFYSYIDSMNLNLEKVKGEQNYVFTGCYTSQSQIKQGNRVCESVLPESETYSMLAGLHGDYIENKPLLLSAWKKTLFNHFHDILPGSGVTQTREFASAYTQEVKACANSVKTNSLINLASKVDLTGLNVGKKLKNAISFGGGAGFSTNSGVYSSGMTDSDKAVFQIFNYRPYDDTKITEITLWDFSGDVTKLVIRDESGKVIKHQLLNSVPKHYWGHTYYNLLVETAVPACGFITIIVGVENNYYVSNSYPPLYERTYELDDYILENEFVCVKFDSRTCAVKSFFDKKNNFELIDKESCFFRLITEDPSYGMTAWRIGRYNKIVNLTESAKIEYGEFSVGALISTFGYTVKFGNNSILKVKATLKNSAELVFDVECDFRQAGDMEKGIEQLSFYMPTTIDTKEYLYDSAFGTVKRKELDEDQVGLSFVSAFNKSNNGVMLTSDSKYGFRCLNNSISMSLIRSSFDPDPTPELGMHKFRISVIPTKFVSNSQLINLAANVNSKFSALTVVSSDENSLKPVESFLKVYGDAVVTAIKSGETSDVIVLRIAEVNGEKQTVKIETKKTFKAACLTDLSERNELSKASVNGNIIECVIEPFSVNTLKIN